LNTKPTEETPRSCVSCHSLTAAHICFGANSCVLSVAPLAPTTLCLSLALPVIFTPSHFLSTPIHPPPASLMLFLEINLLPLPCLAYMRTCHSRPTAMWLTLKCHFKCHNIPFCSRATREGQLTLASQRRPCPVKKLQKHNRSKQNFNAPTPAATTPVHTNTYTHAFISLSQALTLLCVAQKVAE